MNMKPEKIFVATVGVFALLAFTAPAHAERVVAPSTKASVVKSKIDQAGNTIMETKVVTEEKILAKPGAHMYNIADFDLNKDGVLTLDEIGQTLFKMYDTDGNNIIDNIEYERKSVLTVVPVEKSTVVSYDLDGDGVVDEIKRTDEVFMRETQLSRFDTNKDGLSPHGFTGRSFLEADINRDKAIDLSEWRGSYIGSIDRYNKEQAQFNK